MIDVSAQAVSSEPGIDICLGRYAEIGCAVMKHKKVWVLKKNCGIGGVPAHDAVGRMGAFMCEAQHVDES
jgi:hypothetical protein